MPLLNVENLTSGYGRNNIIRGISLAAEEGSITAIIGPNGAGKTTLVQTIAGVVDARGGSVRLGGEPLDGMSARERARRGLGYTPQLRNVFGALSVEDNLEVVTRAMRLPHDRVDEVFELFPISQSAESSDPERSPADNASSSQSPPRCSCDHGC